MTLPWWQIHQPLCFKTFPCCDTISFTTCRLISQQCPLQPEIATKILDPRCWVRPRPRWEAGRVRQPSTAPPAQNIFAGWGPGPLKSRTQIRKTDPFHSSVKAWRFCEWRRPVLHALVFQWVQLVHSLRPQSRVRDDPVSSPQFCRDTAPQVVPGKQCHTSESTQAPPPGAGWVGYPCALHRLKVKSERRSVVSAAKSLQSCLALCDP